MDRTLTLNPNIYKFFCIFYSYQGDTELQVEKSLKKNQLSREKKWSKSIAVENKKYVDNIKEKLGARAVHRQIYESNSSFGLREDHIPYTAHFDTETGRLSQDNTYFWSLLQYIIGSYVSPTQ